VSVLHGSSKRITLTPDVLLEIEAALDVPPFFGIPVGVTLNEVLIVALYNAKRVWHLRARVTNCLRYLYQRYQQPAFSSRDFSQYAGRIVFTWLFDRSDLKELILPLVQSYGHDDTVVVAPLASMQVQMPAQTAFVRFDEFPKIDMETWRSEFDRCLPIWKHQLKQVLQKHSISPYVAEFLLCRLQVQTKRIMAASQFIQVMQPKVIVTEYDRGAMSSCLVLAARQRGIPAVTLIHGAGVEPYPSYGMAPILANFVCCWGDAHERSLLEHGVNHECLVVTGCQSMSRTLDVKQDAARLKIGLFLDKPVVLLATNPIQLEERLKYAMAFCVAMSKLPAMSAIVRLHPAESIIEYRDLVDRFPQVMFLSNSTITRDESLAAADLIVNHESSFGIDALLKGKLVVILDVLATPLKVARGMIELAGCPIAKSAGELESVIRKINVDDDWKKTLHEKAEKYARQYCDSYGQEAANNVCRVINNAIENSQQRAV
jgi:hypothetical protein